MNRPLRRTPGRTRRLPRIGPHGRRSAAKRAAVSSGADRKGVGLVDDHEVSFDGVDPREARQAPTLGPAGAGFSGLSPGRSSRGPRSSCARRACQCSPMESSRLGLEDQHVGVSSPPRHAPGLLRIPRPDRHGPGPGRLVGSGLDRGACFTESGCPRSASRGSSPRVGGVPARRPAGCQSGTPSNAWSLWVHRVRGGVGDEVDRLWRAARPGPGAPWRPVGRHDVGAEDPDTRPCLEHQRQGGPMTAARPGMRGTQSVRRAGPEQQIRPAALFAPGTPGSCGHREAAYYAPSCNAMQASGIVAGPGTAFRDRRRAAVRWAARRVSCPCRRHPRYAARPPTRIAWPCSDARGVARPSAEPSASLPRSDAASSCRCRTTRAGCERVWR